MLHPLFLAVSFLFSPSSAQAACQVTPTATLNSIMFRSEDCAESKFSWESTSLMKRFAIALETLKTAGLSFQIAESDQVQKSILDGGANTVDFETGIFVSPTKRSSLNSTFLMNLKFHSQVCPKGTKKEDCSFKCRSKSNYETDCSSMASITLEGPIAAYTDLEGRSDAIQKLGSQYELTWKLWKETSSSDPVMMDNTFNIQSGQFETQLSNLMKKQVSNSGNKTNSGNAQTLARDAVLMSVSSALRNLNKAFWQADVKAESTEKEK